MKMIGKKNQKTQTKQEVFLKIDDDSGENTITTPSSCNELLDLAFSLAGNSYDVNYTIISDNGNQEQGKISDQGNFIPEPDGNPINEQRKKN